MIAVKGGVLPVDTSRPRPYGWIDVWQFTPEYGVCVYICALQWALSGPSPVDRVRPRSKHHLLTDSGGIPLAISLTSGNRNAGAR